MRRHETPVAIAQALARHRPRRVARLLDPAVGNGLLLEPFFRRPGSHFEAFAVDSDSRPLKRLRVKLGSPSTSQLRVVHADFLEWACSYARRHGEAFDCVVMNPPFAGRKKKWRSLVRLRTLVGLDSVPDVGPVEAGFVLGAMALLKPGGRLLAVLPASVLTAPSCAWIRGVMTSTGAIRHVHELPRYAFPAIESRIYLVAYEKAGHQGNALLLNHDLEEPERLVVRAGMLVGTGRLDFGYYSALARLARLKKHQSLGWRRLGDLATVWRGTKKTPGIGRSVVHTDNYVSGFWRSPVRRRAKPPRSAGARIRAGDILVRRVSRNCAASFGAGLGVRGSTVSDCVLVVRPQYLIASARLLFAVRCLMALDFGPQLLERGTGASYIAQGELKTLDIPYGLSQVYPKRFRLYVGALRSANFKAMQGLESEIRRRIACLLSGPVWQAR